MITPAQVGLIIHVNNYSTHGYHTCTGGLGERCTAVLAGSTVAWTTLSTVTYTHTHTHVLNQCYVNLWLNFCSTARLHQWLLISTELTASLSSSLSTLSSQTPSSSSSPSEIYQQLYVSSLHSFCYSLSPQHTPWHATNIEPTMLGRAAGITFWFMPATDEVRCPVGDSNSFPWNSVGFTTVKPSTDCRWRLVTVALGHSVSYVSMVVGWLSEMLSVNDVSRLIRSTTSCGAAFC